MAADDSYTAADERARAARRAGLQAKKDEQPANTARSYAAKQREWMLKQKRVDYVVVSSKLHVSERSTAPYIVSTSQPPVGRTTLATLSQQWKARPPRPPPSLPPFPSLFLRRSPMDG
jgi:hypothetical protein